MFPVLQQVLWIGLAGFAGTLCRYGLSRGLAHIMPANFPWPTLAVNITGCLLAGFLWGLLSRLMPASPNLRLVLLVGFLGAFTTFSTMMLDSYLLLISPKGLAYLLLNLLLNSSLGLSALVLGVWISQVVFKT